VIDLGVGDPDKPTPDYILQAMWEAAQDDKNHHYPSYKGLAEFRKAVSSWYKSNFNVDLDPNTEVLSLIGSKGGMASIPLALMDPYDVILLPNPCYPAYRPGIYLADGEIFEMPLKEQNNFLPVFEDIPSDVARKAKVMFLNYPSNPTAAVADIKFFSKVVDFAKQNSIIVCHDAPYSEAAFDAWRNPSFLEAPGAKDIGIEFNSCSKTFNMSGWRVAFVVGNKDIISALGALKSNTDMGIFQPLQYAAIKALTSPMDFTRKMSKVYEGRRNILVAGLNELGWNVIVPKASFFMWTRVPCNMSSSDFASAILEKAGVLITPGIGFGSLGEGYIRIALTVDEPILKSAVDRIKNAGFVYKK